jgi:Icc-related predicted phosphoesterase
MVIVYTSDLHGNKKHYQELFELAERKKAQAIIIGGDMLPIHGPFKYSLQEQQDFIFSYLEPQIQDFHSRVPETTIYAMLGNDDWQASNAHLRTLGKSDLLRLLHGEKHDLGSGYELVGYAHVPPTPFTIKDGERRDLLDDDVDGQRCTACVSQGSKIIVVDPRRYFASMDSMEEELQELPTVRDYRKTVFVMHSPPFRTNLDRLFDGRWIGSRAIRDFVEKYQPYLTLHGHIHESSEISGTYLDRIGKTTCINPGQSTEELYAVVFELEDITATIAHTVFGPMGNPDNS